MLSTIHDASIVGTGKIDQNSGQEKMKPNVIVQYNAFMGGVDKLDQMLESYLSLRESMKWYKKLFQHLLDVTVYNSFVLYKEKNPGTQDTLLSFRTKLIDGILTKYCTARHIATGGRRSGSDAPIRLTDRHFPAFIPPTSTCRDPKRECRVCGKSKRDGKRIRKQMRCMCGKCGGVPLCVVPCFSQYHSYLDYAHHRDEAYSSD